MAWTHLGAIALAVCLGLVGLVLVGLLGLLALGAWYAARCRPSRLRTVAGALQGVPGISFRNVGLYLGAVGAADAGDAYAARALAQRLVERLDRVTCPWIMVGGLTDVLVTCGAYRDAFRLPRRWSGAARTRGRRLYPMAYALTQVNRAEALHNLGRDRVALRLLQRVEPLARRGPLAHSALLLLRTWIFANLRQPEAARRTLELVRARPLRHRHLPEICYARAAVAAASGDLDVAYRDARHGLARARRIPSQRNGRFLLASILAARGDGGNALVLFREAARQAYKAQGGPGFVQLGMLLEREAQRDEALAAYSLALDYDPESYACGPAREARLRLEAARRQPAEA